MINDVFRKGQEKKEQLGSMKGNQKRNADNEKRKRKNANRWKKDGKEKIDG